MAGRRSSIEIIAEILRQGESGVGKTRIMYNVNMSHSQLNKYIDLLVGGEFLQPIANKEIAHGASQYRTTAKGKRLLKDIDRISTLLEYDGTPLHLTQAIKNEVKSHV